MPGSSAAVYSALHRNTCAIYFSLTCSHDLIMNATIHHKQLTEYAIYTEQIDNDRETQESHPVKD